MYGWLWRKLPGPTWVKTLEALAMFLVIVAVLFIWIFPWVEKEFDIFDPEFEKPTSTQQTTDGAQQTPHSSQETAER